MRVHHIAFRTSRVRVVARFYREVVGLAPLPLGVKAARARRGSVWLGAGSTIVMIEAKPAREPGISRRSNELVAFGMARRDVATVRERLARHRVVVESESDYSIYFRDPDGRRVAVSTFPMAIRGRT